jgi:hypothetical protein
MFYELVYLENELLPNFSIFRMTCHHDSEEYKSEWTDERPNWFQNDHVQMCQIYEAEYDE